MNWRRVSRRYTLWILTATLILGASVILIAQSTDVYVSLRVLDKFGNPLKNAKAQVYGYSQYDSGRARPDASLNVQGSTDKNGIFMSKISVPVLNPQWLFVRVLAGVKEDTIRLQIKKDVNIASLYKAMLGIPSDAKELLKTVLESWIGGNAWALLSLNVVRWYAAAKHNSSRSGRPVSGASYRISSDTHVSRNLTAFVVNAFGELSDNGSRRIFKYYVSNYGSREITDFKITFASAASAMRSAGLLATTPPGWSWWVPPSEPNCIVFYTSGSNYKPIKPGHPGYRPGEWFTLSFPKGKVSVGIIQAAASRWTGSGSSGSHVCDPPHWTLGPIVH